jgi:acetyl-CoA carboxylase biotin carboxyl carrier protein
MDIRKVKKLIELLEQSQIAEIEIKEGEESVRISRLTHAIPVNVPSAPVMVTPGAAPLAVTPAATSIPPVSPPAAAAAATPSITSPMVGTFYASSAPGQPPLVKVGQAVKRGDIVCIIEAMKIMNPIEADAEGTVSAILLENGQPVEYGQPLFHLAP